jgi:hypothetical protein
VRRRGRLGPVRLVRIPTPVDPEHDNQLEPILPHRSRHVRTSCCPSPHPLSGVRSAARSYTRTGIVRSISRIAVAIAAISESPARSAPSSIRTGIRDLGQRVRQVVQGEGRRGSRARLQRPASAARRAQDLASDGLLRRTCTCVRRNMDALKARLDELAPDGLSPAVGTTSLNLWVLLEQAPVPCGQGVLRTPHDRRPTTGDGSDWL